MAEINDVGNIFVSSDGVHWMIPNFFNFPQECDTVVKSPRIRFADAPWHMTIYPNGLSRNLSRGWFGIHTCKPKPGLHANAVRFGIIGESFRNFVKSRAEIDRYMEYRCMKLVPTSFLKFWKDLLVPDGVLHVYFDIENKKDYPLMQTPFIQISTEDVDAWFKEKFDYTEVATQTDEKIVKEELEQNHDLVSIEEPMVSEKENGMEKLSKDFKELLLNENISDVILKAEDQEFKAHRCVLAARSPVFLAMMTHESKEKISGVVDIPDVDPKTLTDFLSYLYTGSMKNITSENYAELYVTADKYQVNELKKTCLDQMMMNISIDNFCKVLSLSIRHEEKKLKETCINFL